MNSLFEVVHEDASLLLINKPAGLVCHPTKGDVYSSLVSRVRLYLGEGVRAQLINRLDRETSGLVMVAKTDEAAAAMRRRWEGGGVRKGYLAVVEGIVSQSEGVIDAPISPNCESVVAIKGCVDFERGALSETRFRTLHRFRKWDLNYSVLWIAPKTGRKHQIRIHLSHIGHPIVGDKLYGWDETCYLAFVEGTLDEARWQRLRLRNHALHAAALQWTEGGEVHCHAVVPGPEFQDFLAGVQPEQSETPTSDWLGVIQRWSGTKLAAEVGQGAEVMR